MIDLHCHILPALDDGARDLADSVAMARQAEADGIQIVCATPHIRSDHDVQVDELEERIEAVNTALRRQGERAWEAGSPLWRAVSLELWAQAFLDRPLAAPA